MRLIAALLISAVAATAAPLAHAAPSIAGGTKVPAGHPIARTTVALQIMDREGRALCTGSIIDEDLILTAAHCVADALSIRIFFGTELRSTEQFLETKRFFVAPEFQRKKTPDIALVRFEGGLPPGYEPATLMRADQALLRNDAVVIAGYGITNQYTEAGAGVLREASETVLLSGVPEEYEVMLTQSNQSGTCSGDSGGPAFRERDQLLFGVASRITFPAIPPCGLQSIYTNVNHPKIRRLIETGKATLRK